MIPALALGAILAMGGLQAGSPRPKPAPAASATTPRTFEEVSKAAMTAREAGRLDEAATLFRRGLTMRADWDEGRG